MPHWFEDATASYPKWHIAVRGVCGLLRSAPAIKERVLGPDHLDVALSLSNLGVLYDKEGRYADAEPLY
jgi:hypothetical protein